MASKAIPQGLFDGKIVAAASVDALCKLNPRALAKNPVIFVTEVVSLMVTLFFIRDLVAHNGTALFSGQIAAWLWFTVLFANFAEAVAEGRGKAQADALRRTRSDTRAKRYIDPENLEQCRRGGERARSSAGRCGAGRSGRSHSRRRRDPRGRRLGE